MFSRVLVPVTSSESSRGTLERMVAQKDIFTGPVTLIHVVDVDRLAYRMIPDFQVAMVREAALKAGEGILEQHRCFLEEAGLQVLCRLEEGSPRELIPGIANGEGYRLLILGRHTSGEIRDVLFGAVSNHALHQVSCPVLLF